MRHRMTLQNGSTGTTYELLLDERDGSWFGAWRALSSDGTERGPRGETTAPDAEGAFRSAKRAVEDLDEDVIGVDWDFEEPLPPWLQG